MSSTQSVFPVTPMQEAHKVISEHDPRTGAIICEIWLQDGKQDRSDGPALIYRDSITGIATYEAWYHHGQLDRTDGGPALISRDPMTGIITREAWWKDGHKIRFKRV